MTNPKKSYKNRTALTNEEIDAMLAKADKIKNEYFRLRVKAFIGLLKKFGKRRAEISTLALEDLKVENGFLHVKFAVVKKHKRGLFQYIKFLEAQEKPELLNKPLPVLNAEWREWQKTTEGFKTKREIREKKVGLEDKYCKLIIEYRDFVKATFSGVYYLFPSAVYVFGNLASLSLTDHLSGGQLLRLIKPLNRRVWCHLFRDHVGAQISRRLGMSITALAEVQNTLDLEREETAWNYVRRFAVQEIPTEK